jgi:hypothetical protein
MHRPSSAMAIPSILLALWFSWLAMRENGSMARPLALTVDAHRASPRLNVILIIILRCDSRQ